MELDAFLNDFTARSRAVLGSDLVGVYLHGSGAMGCFNPAKSDIDLLLVVRGTLSRETKAQFMAMTVEADRAAPPKGLELSIVRQAVCRPFVYPTPYELHYSRAHLARYQADPEDYIRSMQGTDRDLAAHFTILYRRGRCLWGTPIEEVFEPVDGACYFDSIWFDVESGAEEIVTAPTYMTLNLCRVLAYRQEGLILSKREGGKWGLASLPHQYHPLVRAALEDYTSPGPSITWAEEALRQFAQYMTEQITAPPAGAQLEQKGGENP